MICHSKLCPQYPLIKIGPDGVDCDRGKGCASFVGDPVSHPPHYAGPHECIDLMQALFGKEDVMAFCRCNSFKYRFRAGKKDGSPAEEDLKKAEFYEDLLIEMRQREGL